MGRQSNRSESAWQQYPSSGSGAAVAVVVGQDPPEPVGTERGRIVSRSAAAVAAAAETLLEALSMIAVAQAMVAAGFDSARVIPAAVSLSSAEQPSWLALVVVDNVGA